MSDFNFAAPVRQGDTAKMPRVTDEMLEPKPPEEYSYSSYQQPQQGYAQQDQYNYASMPPNQPPQQWNGRTCKMCGAPIAINAKSCDACGADVRPIYAKPIFWFLMVLLTALVAGGLYLFMNRPATSGEETSSSTSSSASSTSSDNVKAKAEQEAADAEKARKEEEAAREKAEEEKARLEEEEKARVKAQEEAAAAAAAAADEAQARREAEAEERRAHEAELEGQMSDIAQWWQSTVMVRTDVKDLSCVTGFGVEGDNLIVYVDEAKMKESGNTVDSIAEAVSKALYEYSGKVSFSNWDGTTAKPLTRDAIILG